MGPRPRGRGISKRPHEIDQRLLLQWGRDRAVAELKHDGHSREFRRPFNGAATARSRNCQNGTSTPQPGYPLQWGRDRAVAELMGAHRQRGEHSCAKLQWGRDRAVAELLKQEVLCDPVFLPSMGPRPRGRGIDRLQGARVNREILQWGRDRAVAELPVHVPLRRDEVPFNGAATARSRN